MNDCDRYEPDMEASDDIKPCVRCGQVDHSNAAWRASFKHIMTDDMGLSDEVAEQKMANVAARLRGDARPYPEVGPDQ